LRGAKQAQFTLMVTFTPPSLVNVCLVSAGLFEQTAAYKHTGTLVHIMGL